MIRFTVNFLPVAMVVLSGPALALVADIQEAVRRTQPKQEVAADEMDLTAQRLSEFFNGKSPLDVRRLAALPRTFWLELIDLLAERHGVHVVRDDVAQLIATVRELANLAPDRMRMAKAELSPSYTRTIELPLGQKRQVG